MNWRPVTNILGRGFTWRCSVLLMKNSVALQKGLPILGLFRNMMILTKRRCFEGYGRCLASEKICQGLWPLSAMVFIASWQEISSSGIQNEVIQVLQACK